MSHTTFPDTGIVLADTDVVGDVVADFVAAARDWPHRAAIVHNGTAITYRDLAERVRLTALRYRVRGFGADATIRSDRRVGLAHTRCGRAPAWNTASRRHLLPDRRRASGRPQAGARRGTRRGSSVYGSSATRTSQRICGSKRSTRTQ